MADTTNKQSKRELLEALVHSNDEAIKSLQAQALGLKFLLKELITIH